MTTLAHRSALRGPSSGGIAARRPLIRWAWRLFRREWRQQILVIALLTVAVAAAVSSVTIAYNSGPLDYAEFGSANALLRVGRRRSAQAGGESRRRRGTVRDDRRHRPPLAARPGQRRHGGVPGPGPARTVRSALALRRGSYPEGPGQVAVTDGVATLLGLEIGKTLALDGRRRTVVGIVENPRELSDEFALVSPSSAGAPDTVTVLVDADSATTDAFMRRAGRPVRPGGGPAVGAATSRHPSWRCSPWPPSSCSWLRSLPRQASPSSRSDGSASSACSPRSARPRSTFDSCCSRTAQSSARSAH